MIVLYFNDAGNFELCKSLCRSGWKTCWASRGLIYDTRGNYLWWQRENETKNDIVIEVALGEGFEMMQVGRWVLFTIFGWFLCQLKNYLSNVPRRIELARQKSHVFQQFSIKSEVVSSRLRTWNVYDANNRCICISNSPWISIKMQSLKILLILFFSLWFTWTRRILCIGVKWSSASACNPTWSSVERVRVSQMFFAGHHKAWSDQSFGFAAMKRRRK